MDAREETAKNIPLAQPTLLNQQKFLFVDAAQAKTSRQGRHDARRFVMQKARRERPWSTSKNAKPRKVSNSTSPRSTGTPESTSTPNTATPSPAITPEQSEYFPQTPSSHAFVSDICLCAECQSFLRQPGAKLCSHCLLLEPSSPVQAIDQTLFDPFQSSSVEMNASISELLGHCK